MQLPPSMSEVAATVRRMTRAIFHTATTLDGYLATDDDSLDWLFAVPGAREAEAMPRARATCGSSAGAIWPGSSPTRDFSTRSGCPSRR